MKKCCFENVLAEKSESSTQITTQNNNSLAKKFDNIIVDHSGS